MAASESEMWPQASKESDYLIPGPGMTALHQSAQLNWQDPPTADGNRDPAHVEDPMPDSSPTSRPELPQYLNDELAPILASAQEAAARIMERARAEVQVEREQLVRAREQFESSIAELAVWRKNIEPLVQTFHARVAEMQSRINELPELIRTGLDPLASSAASMDPALTAMTTASEALLKLGSPATQ
jgi:hypothetical protein